MELIGKTSINPFLFFSGKIAGYFLWIVYILSVFNRMDISVYPAQILEYISYMTFFSGLVITLLSLFHLGKSIRLGLPEEETIFKTEGIYRFSRNPMYLGFNLFTFSAMILTLHPAIIVTGIYSFYVYHRIILAEEDFLRERFGDAYTVYEGRVRRYL